MYTYHLCLHDRCRQKIDKSKGNRQCKIGPKENICLFCSYVFSFRTGQADRGINAPLVCHLIWAQYTKQKTNSQLQKSFRVLFHVGASQTCLYYRGFLLCILPSHGTALLNFFLLKGVL